MQQMVRLVWQLGYIIAIPAALLGFGGAYLDKHFDTSPLFMVLGFMVAFGISATVVVTLVHRLFGR